MPTLPINEEITFFLQTEIAAGRIDKTQPIQLTISAVNNEEKALLDYVKQEKLNLQLSSDNHAMGQALTLLNAQLQIAYQQSLQSFTNFDLQINDKNLPQYLITIKSDVLFSVEENNVVFNELKQYLPQLSPSSFVQIIAPTPVKLTTMPYLMFLPVTNRCCMFKFWQNQPLTN